MTYPVEKAARSPGAERVARHRAAKRQTAALEYVRPDAALFLDPGRLPQKAGVPARLLRRLALRETVDNALDAGPSATIEQLDLDRFVITDSGPGIAPSRVARIFDVARDLVSTKLIRRPTRGCIGNGSRVIAGSAFASGGCLVVESCGVRQVLDFHRKSGATVVAQRSTSDVKTGTKITIAFGPALPRDPEATSWAETAIRLAGPAAAPMISHPSWYGPLAFGELAAAARGTAGDLALAFGIDLDSELARATLAERYIDPQAPAAGLTLAALQALAPEPPVLLPIAVDAFPGSHRIERGVATVGGGVVPYIVQVWASPGAADSRGDEMRVVINRTETPGDLSVYGGGGTAYVRGCGLTMTSIGKVAKGTFNIVVAITAPAVPVINDGKMPDLKPFEGGIVAALGAALRAAHRPKPRGVSIIDAAFEIMAEAYMKASAGGTLPCNARQIFYCCRPHILERTGKDKIGANNFIQDILQKFLEQNPVETASWDVVYDARGSYLEPHTDRTVPIGTLAVRDFSRARPAVPDDLPLVAAGGAGLYSGDISDRVSALLAIEKEGFQPIIDAAGIREKYDIAVLVTKGHSVTAARAMIDRHAAAGIPVLVAHDLDRAGLQIFGSLGADSRRHRFTNRPDLRRLGLTLPQVVAMGLQTERQDLKGDHDTVLAGLSAIDGVTSDEVDFIGTGRRCELNAMASDVFIAWLERGLTAAGVRKVIPAGDVLDRHAREILATRFLPDLSKIEETARRRAAEVKIPADLADRVEALLCANPTWPWERAEEEVLTELVKAEAVAAIARQHDGESAS